MRQACTLVGVVACLLASTANAAEPTASTAAGSTRWSAARIDGPLPEDVVDPEGRTEWDLRQVPAAGELDRSCSARRYSTAASLAADVERWVFPERDPELLSPGARTLEVIEERDGEQIRLRITTQRLGLGWLYLPSGPREVVLQRALVLRAVATGRGFAPDALIHRWVDPRAGVVAEIRGPVSADGRTRLAVSEAAWVAELAAPQAGLRIYDFQMDPPVLTRLGYGYDRKGVCTIGGNACVDDDNCVAGGGDSCEIPVSLLTTTPHATIGNLIAAPSWDFSANGFTQHRFEVAQTVSPINSAETCSYNTCGFTRPGAKLGRQDKNFDVPASADITTTVQERELRTDGTGQPTDVTLWLRAGVNKEGQTGSLGEGESRICYVDEERTPVPLWRFPHQDALGWYWALGDSWSSDRNPATPQADPFACENTIFAHVCPNSCGLFCRNWIGACPGYTGTQGSAAIGEGPVTLPSGHTFQSLLVRNVAEFCVYIGSGCSSPVFRVRTVIYLWEVPWLGTVVRLTSAQNAADYTSFATVEETDIKFGLFPPRSITVGAVDNDSVEISWDPGLDTHRIDGYKVYWSQVSGSFSDPNSITQPAALGTSAVVGGLAPGTTYYFTVTALSDYTNPKTLATATYESLKYPLTAPALPVAVPLEVTATTTGGTCIPTAEVQDVTARRMGGGAIEMCWSPSNDPCLTGYRILGASSPESDANFAIEVDDTGLATCRTFVPTGGYFLVVARGTGGTGPWGAFGH
jgi:hypothetical protein